MTYRWFARSPAGHSPSAGPVPAGRLSAGEFAARFNESFRLLCLIAAGITRDAALAEDIVQDAAMIALRKLDEFEPGTSFNAWMGQTVRYVALNASRREQHRRSNLIDPLDLDRATASCDRAEPIDLNRELRGQLPADQGYFDDHVMKALRSVSDGARACLLLRTLADLEYSEISTLLRIPEGTAVSHVHRTCKALRDWLAPHYAGWAPTDGG